MMTPQEVASHAFAKATFGGYNMAMVDEFLDSLTADYTALYNDNAILKGKLKVLSDTIEEYRATDNAMRKTLLAAQQMAEAMVHEAEEKKDSLVHDAEAAAARRIEELRSEIAAESRYFPSDGKAERRRSVFCMPSDLQKFQRRNGIRWMRDARKDF